MLMPQFILAYGSQNKVHLQKLFFYNDVVQMVYFET